MGFDEVSPDFAVVGFGGFFEGCFGCCPVVVEGADGDAGAAGVDPVAADFVGELGVAPGDGVAAFGEHFVAFPSVGSAVAGAESFEGGVAVVVGARVGRYPGGVVDVFRHCLRVPEWGGFGTGFCGIFAARRGFGGWGCFWGTRKTLDFAGFFWWGGSGSNRRRPDYESGALTN